MADRTRELGSGGPPDLRVHLAGPPELTCTRVLPALAELVGHGLGLRVTLDRPAERLLAGLVAGSFDIVVSTIDPGDRPVRATPLFEEEFVLVASPGTAAALDLARLRRGPAALDGVPLVAYADDLPIVRRYWRVVFGSPPPARPALVVPDLRGVLAVTVAGGGVTVLPRYLCRDELASGRLLALLDPSPAPATTVYLASSVDGSAGVDRVSRRLLEHAPRW